MKKTKEIWFALMIAAIVVVLLLGVVWFFLGTISWTSRNIDKWNEVENDLPFLPSTKEMGEYSSLSFKHLHKRITFFFQSDAYTLRGTYSAEEYEKQKQSVLETYTFQENFTDDDGVEINTAFEIDGFTFWMLSTEAHDSEVAMHIAFEYPKALVFVGTCDEKREIAFVYYYDFDRDYIDDPLQKFLVEECGWNVEG